MYVQIYVQAHMGQSVLEDILRLWRIQHLCHVVALRNYLCMHIIYVYMYILIHVQAHMGECELDDIFGVEGFSSFAT